VWLYVATVAWWCFPLYRRCNLTDTCWTCVLESLFWTIAMYSFRRGSNVAVSPAFCVSVDVRPDNQGCICPSPRRGSTPLPKMSEIPTDIHRVGQPTLDLTPALRTTFHQVLVPNCGTVPVRMSKPKTLTPLPNTALLVNKTL